ncbi:GNAT family N-acetyltransferase [[Pseudopropionibacterium] massiliense]|uniref:GNAT family N-acetyltransferase n=1 Tax=[Pseudopropionibacterium] massiliense TaxID=2220000 RepID=UPI00102F85E3|nr:GNAT family N-acetyltransferase [[Pseudopropionibacterium] massiliense]
MPSDLLTADLSLLPARVLPESSLRIVRTDDLEALARLYLVSYPPGIGAANPAGALSEIAATFEGDYGVLRPGASLVAEADGRPAGAVLTVERSIWDEGLEGPFVIDLFVDPGLRGRGIGRALMTGAMLACRNAGDAQLSLRVGEGTSQAAHHLYGSLGFRRAGSPGPREQP